MLYLYKLSWLHVLEVNLKSLEGWNYQKCYELKSLEVDKRTNSCIRVNIRELDKKLFTK